MSSRSSVWATLSPISPAAAQDARSGASRSPSRRKQRPRLLRQRAVGGAEAGPDLQVVQHQLVEPSPIVRQPLDEPADVAVREASEPAAGDPECQGYPTAEPDQVSDPIGLRGGPIRTDDPRQELRGGPAVKDVELEGRRAQHRQPAAGGDQHRAAGTARHEGAHLRLARRVVEHDQDAAFGEQVAVQLGPLLYVGGDPLARHAHGPQEPREYLPRVGRLWAGAVQLCVELAVREPGPCLVGSVHGERGLPEPGAAGHRHDPGAGRRVCHRPAGAEGVEDPGQLRPPSDEVGHRRRQQPWTDRRDGWAIRREHRLVRPPQRPSGADAQLRRELLPDPLEGADGVRDTTRRAQRRDQPGVDGLVEGILPGESLQCRDGRRRVAHVGRDVGERDEAGAHQLRDGPERGCLPVDVEIGQHGAAAQADRLGEQGKRLRGIARGRRLAHQPAEAAHVDQLWWDDEPVAGRVALDTGEVRRVRRRPGEPGAQPRGRDVHGSGAHLCRTVRTPDEPREPGDADRRALRHQQDAEQPAEHR